MGGAGVCSSNPILIEFPSWDGSMEFAELGSVEVLAVVDITPPGRSMGVEVRSRVVAGNGRVAVGSTDGILPSGKRKNQS